MKGTGQQMIEGWRTGMHTKGQGGDSVGRDEGKGQGAIARWEGLSLGLRWEPIARMPLPALQKSRRARC